MREATVTKIIPKIYKAFALNNFRKIPQVQQYLSEEQQLEIEVVGNVFPFKVNNYVVDELINWDDVPNDSIFILTFPQRGMLTDKQFAVMHDLIVSGADKNTIKAAANEIRLQLNPHPAGQMELNVPEIDGEKLTGVQHKYRETMLFFPSQGQTCHAYCTFCFRWPQFVGMDELKFAMKETELLIKYLRAHPEITDILFTGGDPLIMKAKMLAGYFDALIEADLPNLKTIRIGSKALGYWPYKFVTDNDAEELMDAFKRVTDAGIHLALMGHFNHPAELGTPIVKQAIENIRATGATIRSQSPLIKNINDDADTWADMWRQQVDLGIIPYYMFVERDTGAQDYFAVPLEKAWNIFDKAYQKVSGICRTVRGPSMSSTPGKVHVIGITEVMGQKVFVLKMIQGRNPDWVNKPFFAKYDPKAIWLDDLEPAFGEEKFFYEDELQDMFLEKFVPHGEEVEVN